MPLICLEYFVLINICPLLALFLYFCEIVHQIFTRIRCSYYILSLFSLNYSCYICSSRPVFFNWGFPGTSGNVWILFTIRRLWFFQWSYMDVRVGWTIKKAERQRIDAFELWCWRRLLRVPWPARRSNQSILKISPGCSLEGLMLKLKLQYFGHLIQRANSSDGRRRGDRGWDGWMISPTQWTWVWANSGRCWRTGKPGVLQFMGLQELDTTEWLDNNRIIMSYVCLSSFWATIYQLLTKFPFVTSA